MKQEIKNPFRGNNCFFCGSENKEGLHIKFYWDEDKQETSAEYLPPPHFVGQGDILHGAFQMGLMDEIMGWTSYVYSQQMSVTTDMNVKFLYPAYIRGERIYVACRVTSRKGQECIWKHHFPMLREGFAQQLQELSVFCLQKDSRSSFTGNNVVFTE